MTTKRKTRTKMAALASAKSHGTIDGVMTSVRREFDINRQGVLVDQALAAHAVYLQAGRQGDRFSDNPETRQILVEVVEGGFSREWDRMYHKQVAADMRARGLKRSEAKREARQVIGEMRKLRSLARMPA